MTTVGVHVAEKSLGFIIGVLAKIKVETQPERRAFVKKNLDQIRKMLMNEPWGNHGMHVLLPLCSGTSARVAILYERGKLKKGDLWT